MAGMFTGFIVGGVGGRLVMRVSAIAAPERVTGIPTEAGNRVGDITVGGTLELVIFVGIFSGLFGALAYLATEPWLEWTGRWHVPVFAMGLLAVASPVVIDPDNLDFAILRNRELNVAMFMGLFIAFGLLIGLLRPVIEVWLSRAGTGGAAFSMARGSAIDPRRSVLLTANGLLIGIAFAAQYLVEEACGCAASGTTTVFSIATVAATVAFWALLVADRLEVRRLRLVRITGYIALAGAVGTGAFRLVSNVREIV
jgi:hypothetical protein